MKKRVLITAGLPYSNGRLHVGHIAGCYLPADIQTRFLRMRGHEVRYVCGSDDHGVAIMMTAAKEGKTPQEIVGRYNAYQQKDFAGMNIQFDAFGSTSQNKYHYETSQRFFRHMLEQGCFEKKSSMQFCDVAADVFLPDRYVKGDCGYCGATEQNSDQCENCGKMLDPDSLKNPVSTMSGKPALLKETIHWYLSLADFENVVNAWLDTADIRQHTRNFVKGLIGTGLVQRSMTRDISWGIPLAIEDPDAAGKSLYVWFDAPIGYISNTMQMCAEETGDPQSYDQWWKSDDVDIYHYIGEDNTIFHCITWIAMLSAEGSLRLPRGVVVNQFLNIKFGENDEAEKISKSRGTAVWIGEYLAEGGDPDVLRYYLTSIAPERARTVYNPKDLIQRNNSELANVLGNFVNRIVSFTVKHCGPQVPDCVKEKESDADRDFVRLFEQQEQVITKALENKSTKSALKTIMDVARDCNVYLDVTKPWATRKTDMERTQVTLYYGVFAVQALAVWLSPFMPEKCRQMGALVGIDTAKLAWDDALKMPVSGTPLQKPEILFARIE